MSLFCMRVCVCKSVRFAAPHQSTGGTCTPHTTHTHPYTQKKRACLVAIMARPGRPMPLLDLPAAQQSVGQVAEGALEGRPARAGEEEGRVDQPGVEEAEGAVCLFFLGGGGGGMCVDGCERQNMIRYRYTYIHIHTQKWGSKTHRKSPSRA